MIPTIKPSFSDDLKFWRFLLQCCIMRFNIMMSKETLVFIIGVFLTILPFLGLPESWRQYAVAITGAILVVVGYILRRALYLSRIDKGNGERGTDSFVETTKQLFDQ